MPEASWRSPANAFLQRMFREEQVFFADKYDKEALMDRIYRTSEYHSKENRQSLLLIDDMYKEIHNGTFPIDNAMAKGRHTGLQVVALLQDLPKAHQKGPIIRTSANGGVFISQHLLSKAMKLGEWFDSKNSKFVDSVISSLQEYEFVYVRNRIMYRIKADLDFATEYIGDQRYDGFLVEQENQCFTSKHKRSTKNKQRSRAKKTRCDIDDSSYTEALDRACHVNVIIEISTQSFS